LKNECVIRYLLFLSICLSRFYRVVSYVYFVEHLEAIFIKILENIDESHARINLSLRNDRRKIFSFVC